MRVAEQQVVSNMTAFEMLKTPYVIGIDPGYTHSGMVLLKSGKIILADKAIENFDLLQILSNSRIAFGEGVVAIETMIYGYGTGNRKKGKGGIGKETFGTCEWVGRFHQASDWKVCKISRQKIKTFVCRSPSANDSGVRFALRRLFSPSGGGKEKEFGIKSKPGPLYYVKSHAVQALAAAVACIGLLHNLKYASQFKQIKLFKEGIND